MSKPASPTQEWPLEQMVRVTRFHGRTEDDITNIGLSVRPTRGSHGYLLVFTPAEAIQIASSILAAAGLPPVGDLIPDDQEEGA